MSSALKQEIAFVCQRYGLEVNGGAELYCRQVAEHLVPFYDVTVYTTCALDYMTWKNHYPAGNEMLNGVTVRRFPVSRERVQAPFDALSQIVFQPDHTLAQEEEWIDLQGPFCPDLLCALQQEHHEYRAVLFMTYLYYTSARGLPLGLPNAMLIPTVHDEPPVYLKHYDKVFASARSIAWNTAEERKFALSRFPFLENVPSVITGIGIEEPPSSLPPLPEALRGQTYLAYAGRIDQNKGCREMFQYFLHYREHYDPSLKLALMGKPCMEIPQDPSIVPLGFVSEELKLSVMANALALVLFSQYESLSMVVLESMNMNTPVIVNGNCAVLRDHCVRSNAGLYFDNYTEFAGIVRYLRSHPEQLRAMGENGRNYVQENYQWDVIIRKYCQLIDAIPERHP